MDIPRKANLDVRNLKWIYIFTNYVVESIDAPGFRPLLDRRDPWIFTLLCMVYTLSVFLQVLLRSQYSDINCLIVRYTGCFLCYNSNAYHSEL